MANSWQLTTKTLILIQYLNLHSQNLLAKPFLFIFLVYFFWSTDNDSGVSVWNRIQTSLKTISCGFFVFFFDFRNEKPFCLMRKRACQTRAFRMLFSALITVRVRCEGNVHAHIQQETEYMRQSYFMYTLHT